MLSEWNADLTVAPAIAREDGPPRERARLEAGAVGEWRQRITQREAPQIGFRGLRRANRATIPGCSRVWRMAAGILSKAAECEQPECSRRRFGSGAGRLPTLWPETGLHPIPAAAPYAMRSSLPDSEQSRPIGPKSEYWKLSRARCRCEAARRLIRFPACSLRL